MEVLFRLAPFVLKARASEIPPDRAATFVVPSANDVAFDAFILGLVGADNKATMTGASF